VKKTIWRKKNHSTEMTISLSIADSRKRNKKKVVTSKDFLGRFLEDTKHQINYAIFREKNVYICYENCSREI
jgi:hypothetical protein